jgi:acyl-CoA reductase-like NAD-dependent aldehyde dehydrogenase
VSEHHLDVKKTYKLLINGASVRSESGRTYEVSDRSGSFLANVASASRKDARDAVVAARAAFGPWSSMTPYNRGQVLYRVAEMLESRRDEFVSSIRAVEGVKASSALSQVQRSIDRVIWYAGWSDKVAQVLGGSNPVAGPYFNFSVPRPCGVVGVMAPQDSSLLGLVSTLAAPLAVGCTVIVVTSESRPLPAVLFGEVCSTSDVPNGVLNILTGHSMEIATVLSSHEDVDALDLSGIDEPGVLAEAAAGSIKRVFRPRPVDVDWKKVPDTRRIRAFTEISTVWHTVGQ